MTLQIGFECPECNETFPLNLKDLAPGQRQVCTSCQTPTRITLNSLERFSTDLQQYCES